MTCYQKISCPECGGTDIMKAGFTGQGKQRYRCRNLECDKSHFLLDYTYRAWVPGVKKQIIDMAINGSGIRDTARVLNIARNTISSTIKKKQKHEFKLIPTFFLIHQTKTAKSGYRRLALKQSSMNNGLMPAINRISAGFGMLFAMFVIK